MRGSRRVPSLVTYAVGTSVLGRLLVATSDRGVCAVSLGDLDEPLERELRRDFPRARLARDDQALAPTLAAVAAHLAGGATPSGPVDLDGTPFQRRVWAALLAVPRGETRSYAEVAASIGLPATAARAVARACAQNRVALLVPCHRVVRGSGDLSGYRWGVERKARLA